MLLQNFDFATKYFDYKSKTELDGNLNLKINGWCKFINGLLTGLLVIDNHLYFLYGDEKILIKDSYKVLLKGSNNTEAELSLFDGNDIIVKFLSPLPDLKLNVSPFEYIDDDTFNWGEFIAKIVNDKERQRNFIMNLMESR